MRDKEFNDIIVKGIQKLRKDKDLTQNELANKLGKSESLVVHWENNQTEVTFKNLMLICEKCNCSLDYLFGRVDTTNNDKITADMAYKYIFNIEFPLSDSEIDPTYFLNLTTDKYILEYFYYEKLLEQKKEQNQITQEEFDFELEKLKEKYSKVFNGQLSKKVRYNCTKIDED